MLRSRFTKMNTSPESILRFICEDTKPQRLSKLLRMSVLGPYKKYRCDEVNPIMNAGL